MLKDWSAWRGGSLLGEKYVMRVWQSQIHKTKLANQSHSQVNASYPVMRTITVQQCHAEQIGLEGNLGWFNNSLSSGKDT